MLTVILGVVGVPLPAVAHVPGAQLPDASYYRAQVTGGLPPESGIAVQVDPGGEWLEISNAGPATVVVLGYTGEPYLRVTAHGVDENELSQTTYLNRSLFADSVPSAPAAGGAAPAWQSIGSTGTVRWHDHRIHWMGRTRPPVVAADPTHRHLVGDWTVHLTTDGAPMDVNGTLSWVGKPNGASHSALQVWLLTLVAGLTVAVAVLVAALVRVRRQRPPAVE